MDSTQQPSTSTHQCSICTQEAHGIHFGVYSCRACAAFFRRCIVLKRAYLCKKIPPGECGSESNCRSCRLEKCFTVGMTEENVQLNRDRMSSVVSKRPKSPREPMKPCELDPQPKEVIHAKELLVSVKRPFLYSTNRRLNEIFAEEYSPPPVSSNLSGLVRMSMELQKIRTDQPEDIEVLSALDVKTHLPIWEKYIFGQIRWLLSCEEYAKLETNTKIAMFDRCWGTLMRLERFTITVEKLKEKVFTKRLVYAFDRFAIDDKTTFVPFSNPNADADEVRKIFSSSFNNMIDVVCPPIFELNLSVEEITYILLMVLWHVEGTPVEEKTLEMADKARERLSSELHDYYLNTRKMKNYANRLISIMLVIKNMERVQGERNKLFEMAHFFDYFGKKNENG